MTLSISIIEQIARILVTIIGYVIAVTVAGCAAASINWLVGDETARNEGLLSLNPAVHIDFFAVISFALLGLGWSRFIPFDEDNVPCDSFVSRLKRLVLHLSAFFGHMFCSVLAICGLFVLFGFSGTFILVPAFNRPVIPLSVLAAIAPESSGFVISSAVVLLKIISVSLFFAAFSLIFLIVAKMQEKLRLYSPDLSLSDKLLFMLILAFFLSPLITDVLAYVLSIGTVCVIRAAGGI